MRPAVERDEDDRIAHKMHVGEYFWLSCCAHHEPNCKHFVIGEFLSYLSKFSVMTHTRSSQNNGY
jgi:hypothetical protein